MNIETIVVGSFQCNCRVISSPKTKEAIIVDAGDEAWEILDYVKNQGLTVKALVHTHAHLDHIMATAEVKDGTGAPIYLHRGDEYLYQNLPMQAARFNMKTPETRPVDTWLEHEMEIPTADFKLKTLYTPGHTPGSCCFHFEGEESILFSGDTLFQDSIGRTDLWGGDLARITKSIKERLYKLDDDTIVLSGHGDPTTIGHEKRYNPFVRAK